MKSILVTGATGFLGKHLVEQLRQGAEDARVRILSRGPAPWPSGESLEVVRGDVLSRADAGRACEGIEEVFHLAGIVARDPREASLLYRTHIEGTRNILEAARAEGVRKIVVVSSSGTVAVRREPVASDETAGYTTEIVAEWPYYLSKIFQEKLALDYAAEGLPVVVVNPSLLLGPGDERLSSTGDIALFLRGQILAIPQGGLNFLDARDGAAGLIAAMRAGRSGERYLLGGPNWTFRKHIESVAEISGRRVPRLQPSLSVALQSARLLRRLYRMAGKSFDLDEASIKMSALFWYVDSSKARRELGFTARDPMETLRETVEDLRRRI